MFVATKTAITQSMLQYINVTPVICSKKIPGFQGILQNFDEKCTFLEMLKMYFRLIFE